MNSKNELINNIAATILLHNNSISMWGPKGIQANTLFLCIHF